MTRICVHAQVVSTAACTYALLVFAKRARSRKNGVRKVVTGPVNPATSQGEISQELTAIAAGEKNNDRANYQVKLTIDAVEPNLATGRCQQQDQ